MEVQKQWGDGFLSSSQLFLVFTCFKSPTLIFQPGVSVTISEPQRVVSFSLELAALVFSVLSLRFYFSMSYV